MPKIPQRYSARSFRTLPPSRTKPGTFRISVDRKKRVKSRRGTVGQQFAGAMDKSMGRAFAATAQNVAFAFYLATPRDTGYARSRWEIRRTRTKHTYFIDNDTPYIQYLEAGWSDQAPLGITPLAMQYLRAEGVLA